MIETLQNINTVDNCIDKCLATVGCTGMSFWTSENIVEKTHMCVLHSGTVAFKDKIPRSGYGDHYSAEMECITKGKHIIPFLIFILDYFTLLL